MTRVNSHAKYAQNLSLTRALWDYIGKGCTAMKILDSTALSAIRASPNWKFFSVMKSAINRRDHTNANCARRSRLRTGPNSKIIRGVILNDFPVPSVQRFTEAYQTSLTIIIARMCAPTIVKSVLKRSTTKMDSTSTKRGISKRKTFCAHNAQEASQSREI